MGSKRPIRPKRLKAGSRIGLVAPAGPLLEPDDLVRGEELCRALGYEAVALPHAASRHGYLAGSDEDRLADLNRALADPALDAVWCLRGGYGTTRILDGVDFDAVARQPKAVIGFSDITSLLVALLSRAGVVGFHGPVARRQLTGFSRKHLDRALRDAVPPGRLERLPPPPDVLVPERDRIVTLTPGVAEGPLVGGNLSLLQCLLGTRYWPDLDGAILFLEDVDEDLYAVDRMLVHLRMAGALQRVAGVIVGRFTELRRGTPDGALGYGEVLATYLASLGVPAAYGFPIGHIDDQWTLPLGVRARLDATAGEVELLEPAVS